MVESALDGDVWAEVEPLLPTGYADWAWELGVMKRWSPHMGTKLDKPSDLLRMVLHHATGHSSLVQTTQLAALAGLPRVSAVALHKQEKKVGPWLERILGAMLAQNSADTAQALAPVFRSFRVVVADATTVSRPGATGTTARVHAALTLPDMRLVHCEVTDASGGESLRRYDVQQGELWVVDRGYAHPPGIEQVHRSGASVVVRVNRSSLPLWDAAGNRIHVDEATSRVPRRGVPRERRAWVHTDSGPVEGRLCITWLPKEQAEVARAQAPSRAGRPLDEKELRASEYVVLFTTAPKESLPLEAVFEVYAARWQIELEFKRAKSLGALDHLPNMRPDTVRTWILANLILQHLARSLATRLAALSPRSRRRRPETRPTEGRAPRTALDVEVPSRCA